MPHGWARGLRGRRDSVPLCACGVAWLAASVLLFGSCPTIVKRCGDALTCFTGLGGTRRARPPPLLARGCARFAQPARPDAVSEEDAHRFSEAGYSVRSAVFGTVPQESTRDIFEMVRDLTRLPDVGRFLENGTFVDLGSGEGELVVN